ncbi:hypothetical protein SAMN05216474_1164 [Lishizhenia tianjinensis]|uniref:Uncharacterized protein n=1 Tax=Lishizhenia tianjinensis TaxID=477690 RepID=A0A1I6YTM9_9FLAO|nr:hypothetical protein [Lishizhenia tianjinensis]SFT53779.1 hypothetical protein SAMN05216474_1164 [Lishizhenia tianjinensis]
MSRFSTILTLSFLLVLSACKKDEMPELVESNEPVFMVKGKIGQEEINIVAGDDNQYMYTGFDERNGVNLFYGDISNNNSSFKLTIHDGNLDNDNLELITNQPQFAFTRNAVTPTFQFAIDSFANNVKIDAIDWYVNGDYYSSNSITLYEHGLFNICAEVTFVDGEVANLCNDVILGYKKHAIGQPVHIVGSTGRLSVFNNTIYPIDNVEWYVNGVLFSDAIELSTSAFTGRVPITVIVNYSNGVQRTKSIMVDFDLEGKFIQDFSFAENINPLNNDYSLDLRFEIDGETWISNIPENDSLFVEISKYEKYKENVDGIPVSIANGLINCKLKRLSDGMIRDAELDLTFGFPQNF